MIQGRGSARVVFAVPAGSGSYAPEILYLTSIDTSARPRSYGAFDSVGRLRVLVESLVSTAELEIDVLKVGGDPATAGDWITDIQSYTAAGLGALLELAGMRGIRLRCKSGGTDGNMPVSVWWEW